jgi:uncharacterized protein YodC (DUF2158 family)
MRHYALTHSLTVIGGHSSAVRMIVLARKQAEGMLPCYWFRVDGMDFAEAISFGRAALSEGVNIVVAMARGDVPDKLVAAEAAQALARAGLNDFHLHPGALSLPGAAA